VRLKPHHTTKWETITTLYYIINGLSVHHIRSKLDWIRENNFFFTLMSHSTNFEKDFKMKRKETLSQGEFLISKFYYFIDIITSIV